MNSKIDPKLWTQLDDAGDDGEVEAFLSLDKQAASTVSAGAANAGEQFVSKVSDQTQQQPSHVRYMPRLSVLHLKGPGKFIREALAQDDVVAASSNDVQNIIRWKDNLGGWEALAVIFASINGKFRIPSFHILHRRNNMTAKKPAKQTTKTITKQSTKKITKTVVSAPDSAPALPPERLSAELRPEDNNLWIITSSAVDEFHNKTADPSDAAAITDFLKDPFGVNLDIVGQVRRITLREFIQVDADTQMDVHKDPFWVKVSTKKGKAIPAPEVWEADRDLLFYTSFLDKF